MQTVGEILNDMWPTELKKWDRWDYKIYSPISLDDEAVIHVILINEDTTRQEIFLPAEWDG